MTWTEPEAREIKMDAEISSYQEDADEPMRDGPPFAQPLASHVEAEK